MRRANKGVLPSVLGVEGYNPSVGATDKELGKPGGSASDDSAVAAPSPAVVPDPSSTVRSSTAPSAPASLSTSTAETKESIMRSVDGALTTICRYRTGGDGGQALKMLTLYIQNIVQNPSESKYVLQFDIVILSYITCGFLVQVSDHKYGEQSFQK